MFTKDSLLLYFIMGSQDCQHHSPLDTLTLAIAGGITCFQFREKHSGLTMGETVELGRVLREECRRQQIPFVVNDRVDLALILDADGVHVGQDDIPVNEVRQLTANRLFVGVSARTPDEAEQAVASGADYLGVGPMFPTRSKNDAKQPIGPQGLATLRQQFNHSVPLVAIGGIQMQHLGEIFSAGADGVAIISAIASNRNPEKAAQTLAQIAENKRGRRERE